MKITILGSGTGQISLNRSSSAYWLQCSAGSFLIDCGSGTLKNLLAAGGDYLEIDGVFFTHTHVDHVGELAALIHALRHPTIEREKPLYLYGTADFVELFHTHIAPLCGLPSRFTLHVETVLPQWHLGDMTITTENMIHTPRMASIGYRFQENGQTIVFSGDCDWCPGILTLGQAADLLVLDCSCLEINKFVGHLSAGECGRIAEQCQAKGVVLSHFYPIPAHDEARRQECARYYGGRIYLAEDLDVYEWQGERFQPVNKQSTWDNIQLMAREFRKSRIILAAHNLGIFATLAQGRVTAQQLAQKRNLSLRGCRLLLDSLTSLGVIHKEGETYQNTPAGDLHLHEAGEQSMINIMGHIAHMERSWMGLEDAVQSGEPVHLPDQGLIHNQARNQIFIGAMAEMGRGWARQIVKIIDFSNCHSLLDLGGGPGVYAMEFMAENPQLNSVLIDLPITLASAVPFIQQSPVAHRLTCKGVDFYQPDADIGQGYDAVLISNVLHVEGEEANRLLLKKVYDAMLPGGILLLHETIINPDRVSPQERALFAVNMLVHTQRGNCYTFEEMAGWLTEAGFVRILLEPRMDPPSLIVAYKD